MSKNHVQNIDFCVEHGDYVVAVKAQMRMVTYFERLSMAKNDKEESAEHLSRIFKKSYDEIQNLELKVYEKSEEDKIQEDVLDINNMSDNELAEYDEKMSKKWEKYSKNAPSEALEVLTNKEELMYKTYANVVIPRLSTLQSRGLEVGKGLQDA